MHKIIPIVLFLSLLSLPFSPSRSEAAEQPSVSPTEELYRELGLCGKVDYTLFERAYAGYSRIDGRQKEVLTLIDFTKPSTDKRLFVIDLGKRKLLFETHVAHGQNSGEIYATSFSNRTGSHQSSLGFYLTANTYIGKSGYSLRLDGLEAGINDNARARAVVIHGAAYAEPSVVAARGRLGRSWGCPALPASVSREVIDAIRGGSVLFIYAADSDYLARSSFSAPPARVS